MPEKAEEPVTRHLAALSGMTLDGPPAAALGVQPPFLSSENLMELSGTVGSPGQGIGSMFEKALLPNSFSCCRNESGAMVDRESPTHM